MEANTDKIEGAQFHSDHGMGERVDVVLGNGLVVKGAWITAVKFSEGGHVHFDLVYVTHEDDDGTRNFQKLYRIPTGLINKIAKA